MLSRLRRRHAGVRPDPSSVNHSPEHVTMAKTIARRKRVVDAVWERIPLLRATLAIAGVAWLLALPYNGLWKHMYQDEHALQAAQVRTYYDWAEVHKADRYLDTLEQIVNSTFEERTAYLQDSFAAAGLHTGNTSKSTYTHVRPPRSKGTETILLSANWVSRDGTPNLRGIATLLSMGDFLHGQNHWASDFVLVAGEGYTEGLEDFMRGYYDMFPGAIWTALNIDYPGHSFSHLGLFYEGVHGRLPNQDIVQAASSIAQWTGGVITRIHNIVDEPRTDVPAWLGDWLLAAKHLLHHFGYMATGRASAAHGVLARHRIDSVTLYCTPATGPHGFHTLGRTLESTLRSMNNLLERLHASYFFYLIPRPGQFIPVGHYLPAAVLLGASLTLGGFDCPVPLQGLLHILPAFVASALAWAIDIHPIFLMGAPMWFLPRGKDRYGPSVQSARALTMLLYGALIPTLAMVNFPQAILLALIATAYLNAPEWIGLFILACTQPGLLLLVVTRKAFGLDLDLAKDWVEVGNLTWPVGVYGVWLPLWLVSVTLL
ncbi:hypothetical protein IAU60_003781 [Kwoniella sp. DSM 27419]